MSVIRIPGTVKLYAAGLAVGSAGALTATKVASEGEKKNNYAPALLGTAGAGVATLGLMGAGLKMPAARVAASATLGVATGALLTTGIKSGTVDRLRGNKLMEIGALEVGALSIGGTILVLGGKQHIERVAKFAKTLSTDKRLPKTARIAVALWAAPIPGPFDEAIASIGVITLARKKFRPFVKEAWVKTGMEVAEAAAKKIASRV